MIRFTLLPVVFCLIFLTQKAWCLGEKEAHYLAGFLTIGVSEPGSELAGEIFVWYPADKSFRSQYSTNRGSWIIRAGLNAPPAKGLFPVILLSHDMAREGIVHHDLCSALAQAGFVVIAPTHFADNTKDANAIFSAALYYHRPRQLVAALQTLAQVQRLNKIINPEQIGVLGSGTGAATVLQLAGVDIDPASYPAYCRSITADEIFCNKWANTRLTRLSADTQAIRIKYGKGAFTPRKEAVKAVGLLAPGGLFLLNKDDLAGLKPPLAVVYAEQDELYKTETFPEPLSRSMLTYTLNGLDHYSVNAPCPEDILRITPDLCGATPQETRLKAAQERDHFFISFFRAKLGLPLEDLP